jgi:hypothetical protein
MVYWCTCPGSIPNRNNLGYRSACLAGTLAFPGDISRVYSAGYSYCYFRMAWKNVASFFPFGASSEEPSFLTFARWVLGQSLKN